MLRSKFIYITLLLFFIQCNNNSKNLDKKPTLDTVSYANGFQIETFDTYKKLTIHRAFQGNEESIDYYLVPKTQDVPKNIENKNIIRTPVRKIIVTSTSHITMLESIGEIASLVGFPNTSYISSKTARILIDDNSIIDIGNEQAMNLEKIITLEPDIVIGFGVDKASAQYEQIQAMGIPVLMNSDWMEEHPLGRAEWVKFFGVLYEKDTLSNDIFYKIKTQYQTLQNYASKSSNKPTVMSGALYQDIWYTPAGDSFLAKIIADAHAQYIWAETPGNGSLTLNIESVLEKSTLAAYWIAPSFLESKQQMKATSKLYTHFTSFQQDKIYSYTHLKGETGGLIYFEQSPLHPEWVLEDLIHIFHSELSDASYTFHFFKKME